MTPIWSTTTSGDMIADRRYAWGDAALAEGDGQAARDLFEQTLEQVPHWPPAHFALGKACLMAGDEAGARAALEQARRLDPADRLGAGLLLARLGGSASREAMPDHFVAALFDEYAPRFDSHLVESLGYRAPRLIATLLARHPAPAPEIVYDLGCGTGLMAQALPGEARWHGVDLSPAMLAEAEKLARYETLEAQELLGWLRMQPMGAAQLVLAADVFCYVPELEPVFIEVARVLAAGGRFAFSIQTHQGENGNEAVVIGADLRVHHAPALIHVLAHNSGLHLVEEEQVSTRKDRGVDVPGALFLFEKRGL